MTKVFDEKLKRFVDNLPRTAAAEARATGKTTDAKDCGCNDTPTKGRTVDRMRFTDGDRRAWRIGSGK